MLFNSPEFFVFFAIVYSLYRVLPFRSQNSMLLIAGYVFYGCWDIRFLFLIAFSTTVDFSIGLMLGEGRIPRRQRLFASLFLIGSAFLFLCIDWNSIQLSFSKKQFAIDWRRLFAIESDLGLATLVGTTIFVVVANVFYPFVVGLDEIRRKRLLLFVTVFVNLSFLGFFKYFNFFIDSAEVGLHALGLDSRMFRLHILLPVGISFYTFQSLSYTIDVSRGLVKPAHYLWDFALFVAYFPPMVAGPIERGRQLLPQLLKERTIRLDQSSYGVLLILIGLFKKVAIADGIAPSVDGIYNSTGAVSQVDVLLATLLFAIQIYCDFSGYSDIAIGVSKMLGIELMTNFNLPYFSRNPSEFWRRWHISLSSWLRDYLYIPLGGNRKGEVRTYFNLMITMVLGGLWHGAAWNYVFWGFYQGALLCVHRLFVGDPRKASVDPSKDATGKATVVPARSIVANAMRRLSIALSIAFFFLFICYGWLLFRATSIEQIATFTKTMLGFGPSGLSAVIPRPSLSALLGMPLLLALQLIDYVDRSGRGDVYRFWPSPLQGLLYATIVLILVMGTSNAPVQFIYFQF